jgi:hypothetical protein
VNHTTELIFFAVFPFLFTQINQSINFFLLKFQNGWQYYCYNSIVVSVYVVVWHVGAVERNSKQQNRIRGAELSFQGDRGSDFM